MVRHPEPTGNTAGKQRPGGRAVAHPVAACVRPATRLAGGHTQHYFDSRGVVRVYAMTFDGLVWTLERSTPDFTPLHFGQRFVGTLAEDGSAITGPWQTATDGGPWARDFDLTYSRVQ
jgi:hypothetical protein